MIDKIDLFFWYDNSDSFVAYYIDCVISINYAKLNIYKKTQNPIPIPITPDFFVTLHRLFRQSSHLISSNKPPSHPDTVITAQYRRTPTAENLNRSMR